MKRILSFLIIILCTFPLISADAAPINYSVPQFVYLKTSGTLLTISDNSSADSLVVHDNSIDVTVSASTNEIFIVSATSTQLQYTTNTISGNPTQSCIGGTSIVNLAQLSGSGTYTVSPVGSSPCVQTIATTVNGGGNGNGPIYMGTPPISAPTTPTTPPSGMLSTTTNPGTNQHIGAKIIYSYYPFAHDFGYGQVSRDVRALQEFLIAQDVGPAAATLRDHGTTAIFGDLTRNALIEFQQYMNITPATGYCGPSTRAVIESM